MTKGDSIKIGLAVAALAVAGVVASVGIGGRRAGPPRQFYMDLSTGTLFADDVNRVAPFQTAGGGQAVRVFVVGCEGACGEKDRHIVHLEKYGDDVLPLIGKKFDVFEEEEAANTRIQNGVLVAAPPEKGAAPQWHGVTSPAGQQILSMWRTLCGGGQAKPCSP